MFSFRQSISKIHRASRLRLGVCTATPTGNSKSCFNAFDSYAAWLETCRMSTKREVTVTTSLSRETVQHTLDEIDKCIEVGIGSTTLEEAKEVLSSLTSCLEENEVLRNNAVVALTELRASMSQPNGDVIKEKIINAEKVLQSIYV